MPSLQTNQTRLTRQMASHFIGKESSLSYKQFGQTLINLFMFGFRIRWIQILFATSISKEIRTDQTVGKLLYKF